MVPGMDSVTRILSHEATRGRAATYLWLGLIVVVAAAVRGFHLGARPFWIDEMYSVWFSQRTWTELWTLVPAIETHSPLYYTLLKAWAWLEDYREWWLRTLSVVASVLCIPVIYAVVTRMSVGAEKQWCGLAAAGALALNHVQLMYAQETRPYALLSLAVGVTLFGVASFYAIVTAAPGPGREQAAKPVIPDGKDARLTATLVIACAFSTALWLHNTALVLFGLPVILLAIGILRLSQRPAHDFAWLALAGLLVLVLWSPNIRWITGNVSALRQSFWLHPPGVRDVAMSLVELFGYMNGQLIPWVFALALNVAMAGFTALGLLKALRVAPHAAFAATVILCVPIAICVLVSWAVVPIFLVRTLVWVAFGQAAALGWFIALGRPEFLFARAGMVASVAAITIAAMFHRQPAGDPWPDAVRSLRADAAHTSLIVFAPNFLEFPIRWYGGSPTADQEFLPMPAPFPALGRSAYPSGLRGEPAIEPTDVALLARHVAGKQQVWIVSRNYHLFDREGFLYMYLQCSRGPPQTLVTLGELRLWRFGPATVDDRESQSCLRQVYEAREQAVRASPST
jgi:mannosyltransferase